MSIFEDIHLRIFGGFIVTQITGIWGEYSYTNHGDLGSRWPAKPNRLHITGGPMYKRL